LQHELGLSGPFICDGGQTLYIPRGYFEELDGLSAGDAQWEVFSFPGGDPTRAVRLLTSLFAAHTDDDLVTVGLGCDWPDRGLLRAVDVPVVVRNDGEDQRRLLRSVPNAYLTTAAGGNGWSEAVLGSSTL
jgi:predicted mannosyl-3-phosphoglycerate phosphatase (HAD superfamily)